MLFVSIHTVNSYFSLGFRAIWFAQTNWCMSVKLSNYLKNLICPQLGGEFVLEMQTDVLLVFLKLAKAFARTAAFLHGSGWK